MTNFEKAANLVAEVKATKVALESTFNSLKDKVEELDSLQDNIHSFAVEDLRYATQIVLGCLSTICGERD